MGCWIQLANLDGQEKSGYGIGENKVSFESATKYIDSGNSNKCKTPIGNVGFYLKSCCFDIITLSYTALDNHGLSIICILVWFEQILFEMI